MLAQSRLNEAEQLTRAAIRILENSGYPSDSGLMCTSRALLGDILFQKEDFPEAMKQYDLAREGLKENAYLYEMLFPRKSNLIVTLLRAGRPDEAMEIISRVYEWNRKKLRGKAHGDRLNAGIAWDGPCRGRAIKGWRLMIFLPHCRD